MTLYKIIAANTTNCISDFIFENSIKFASFLNAENVKNSHFLNISAKTTRIKSNKYNDIYWESFQHFPILRQIRQIFNTRIKIAVKFPGLFNFFCFKIPKRELYQSHSNMFCCNYWELFQLNNVTVVFVFPQKLHDFHSFKFRCIHWKIFHQHNFICGKFEFKTFPKFH